MISFPNCKINLGLHILNKRDDDFHNLETVFYPLPLRDGLEIIQENTDQKLKFSSSGLAIDGEEENNICIKAYHLLKKDFDLPPVQIHLHKAIPVGAGLGGGSADGAFTLMLLNKKFNLQLTEDKLIGYALQLGSDCPFFIKNNPCLATGRGEILEEILLDLSFYKIVIVNPQIHINTGWAFSKITPETNRISIKEIINLPIENWKDALVNDFEKPIFQSFTEIKNLKEELYKSGAIYAAMSGSGSTVFGIFDNTAALKFSFPAHYFVKQC